MGMGPIVWTCLALTLHQGPVQEWFLPKRAIVLPIKTNPDKIREIQALILLVSNDKGRTWEPVDKKAPDVPQFIYHAPADGSYWFIIQQEDRAGRATPANPERVKPNQAVIVDTVPPLIHVSAERLPSGAIRVHWKASDAYPSPLSVRLEYHTSAHKEDQWFSVLPSPVLEGDKEFDPGSDGKTGEVRVRVQMKDQAGNTGEGMYVLHAAASSAVGAFSAPPPGPAISLIPPTRSDTPVPPNHLTSRQSQQPAIEAPSANMAVPAPMLPHAELSGPAPSPPAPFAGMPIAGNADATPPSGGSFSGALPNSPGVKIVKSRQVRIDFTVGKVGPSGLGNADVYVSFDKGASWKPMQGEVPISLPSGTDIHGSEVSGSVGVQLPSEGIIYGFIVAAKSKAGLAPPPPKPGDLPQALVEWDNTAPKGQLYRPQPDPNQLNTLLLAWKVEDRNLGDKPITLEWAELKDGPWNPIGEGPLPNTGQYAWRLPERLPPRVYLRLSMRDLAGNESRAQTDKPELIDLSVPQTRIIGVAPAAR
jgi:hypothetical protein